ncbi:unnamed protein product [Hymenolepis diminuta]|uniref:Uncharacterized protein n=1 Tax=Hymenolepis diminuta TaxID=6216 RepID=A0A0R3SVB1_HYMDI|nr:unnamed protein product [Hymenolepis diminuta]
MSKFFGASLFKKSNSSSGGNQVQKNIANRENSKTSIPTSTVMWDTICDLNSSSDLDESTDFFYSRPNLLSPISDKPSSPFQTPSEKSVTTNGLVTNTNRWKTNFMLSEASNARQARTNEPKVNSPSLSRLQTKSQNSPSLGFRYESKFGKSPALKSPSSTLVGGLDEIDEPKLCPNKRISPKLVSVSLDANKKRDIFNESELSLDFPTNDTDNVEKDNEEHSTYRYCPDNDGSKESTALTEHEIDVQQDDQESAILSNRSDKLDFLHMKLKNEAVKLESWKNEMINKLNQNEEKLNDANNLVANLRKSNLELQMQTENASLKLKDEIEKREATEKKINGTRDLCEVIRTQIELVRSTCSSTMQTCFKTATVQKSLEMLLKDTFEDFHKLKIKLDGSTEMNNNLIEQQRQMNEQHEKQMQDVISQNAGLKSEIGKYVKEKSENDSYIRKFDEDVTCLMLKTRSTNKNMESMLQQASQTRNDLETELQRATIELENLKICHNEKDCQLTETAGKCDQLAEDLSRVHAMMQNSKNSCLERSKRITELENEIKQLTDKIGHLQEDNHKKVMEYEAERRLGQKKLLQLTEKLNSILPAFDALVFKKEELLRAFEKEKGNSCIIYSYFVEKLHEELSQNKIKWKCAEIKENELLANIKEYEKAAHEKERIIETLRHSASERLKEVENLKSEVNKYEASYRDLEESHKILNASLAKAEIVRLEERLQESEQQVRVLENAASRAGDEMRTSSASLAQRDAELAQMRGALAAAQAAHTAATKRCEEIRSDLLGAVEQQQQESDRALRQKEKQIESLQESLNSLQKESGKSSKRIEKKITDNLALVEKLSNQLKECTQEKKEIAKQLATSKQKSTKLEKEISEKKAKISNMEEQIENRDAQIKKLGSEKDCLTALLNTKDLEIEKLRRIEAEFADFIRSVTENTPPCSTQILKAPEMEAQVTPQSPFRAEKFNQMVLLKTPQKTPKSILKQPGSECKRRRVLLISPERTSEKEDTPETQKNEIFKFDSMETVDLDATPERDGAPKLHLVPNIRKTPSTGNANRGPPTNTRTSTRQTRVRNHAIASSVSTVAAAASEASWFDSDETFGLGAEE